MAGLIDNVQVALFMLDLYPNLAVFKSCLE